MKKVLLFGIVLSVAFVGCSNKKLEDINQPADFYYQKMVKNIAQNKLEEADSSFTMLSSVHTKSPLIPEAILILADGHMDSEDYVMAKFYFDEYLKRYGDKRNMEYIKYMKVKADFMGFKLPLRDQQGVIDAIGRCDEFLKEYPNSQYTLYVETMKTKLDVALKLFDLNIAQTYERVDKPDASEKYLEKANASWVSGKVDYKAPSISWWRDLFEVHWLFNPYPNPKGGGLAPQGGGNVNLATDTEDRYFMEAQ